MSETKIMDWVKTLPTKPSTRLYKFLLLISSGEYFNTKESLLELFLEKPNGGKVLLRFKNFGWKCLDELCTLLEVPLIPRHTRNKSKKTYSFTKDQIIHIGLLLKSVNDFERKIYLNHLPDPKNSDKVYVQARASTTVNKKTVWFGKYVGVKDRYTKEDLLRATTSIKQRYRDHVNKQLSVYNCQIEDFS